MFIQFFSKLIAYILFLPYVFCLSVFDVRAKLTRNSLISLFIIFSVIQLSFRSFFAITLPDHYFVKESDIGNILPSKMESIRQNEDINTSKDRIYTGIIEEEPVISKGKTLSHILGEASIGNTQIFSIANYPLISKVTLNDGYNLKLKYSCEILYNESVSGYQYLGARANLFPPRYNIKKNCILHYLRLPLQDARILEYNYKDGVGKFSLKKLNTIKSNRVVMGTISHSLYGDALRSGVPRSIIGKMLKEYGYMIDFQRDIHRNDIFSVVFEEIKTEEGELIRNGDLLFANLKLNQKEHKIYLFEKEYYNHSGESIKRTLLKTPIDGARISSPFGRRTHPILGYTREHKGIDFAAPTGTPVYSAGDGVIEFAGVKSGYGKFVTVKHNNDLKTNYAHLNNFGKIKKGQKVKQREIVGYVGSTGMATGPHLHFEMIVKNQKVNPKSSYFSTAKKLEGEKKKSFNKFQNRISSYFN